MESCICLLIYSIGENIGDIIQSLQSVLDQENKNFLKTISFQKASCSISSKSMDFKYF